MSTVKNDRTGHQRHDFQLPAAHRLCHQHYDDQAGRHHSSTRTTQLYNRLADDVTLDDVERVLIQVIGP